MTKKDRVAPRHIYEDGKKGKIASVSKDVERLEPLRTASRNVKYRSHGRKEYGGSSKS